MFRSMLGVLNRKNGCTRTHTRKPRTGAHSRLSCHADKGLTEWATHLKLRVAVRVSCLRDGELKRGVDNVVDQALHPTCGITVPHWHDEVVVVVTSKAHLYVIAAKEWTPLLLHRWRSKVLVDLVRWQLAKNGECESKPAEHDAQKSWR
jgi:hypothetical protein